MEEKSKVIFGNPMPDKVYRKAVKSKKKYAKKFGDDAGARILKYPHPSAAWIPAWHSPHTDSSDGG